MSDFAAELEYLAESETWDSSQAESILVRLASESERVMTDLRAHMPSLQKSSV